MNKDMLAGNATEYAPLTPEEVASYSIDWWLTVEDLPGPNNQIRVEGDRIVLDRRENNSEPHARLEQRWIETIKAIAVWALPERFWHTIPTATC